MVNLLATKLHRPSLPPQRVARPQVIQRLNEGLESGRQITLVSAPAGFGKTLCVSEWIHALELPVTWLSLDPSDDDPGRFFTYLLAALQKVDENIGGEIQKILLAGQLPPGEIISATLINAIQPLEARFLLVLDDFQVIQDRFILQVMENLIDNLPEGCCVEVPVLASKRGLSPIHVGELPAHLAILNNISARCEELAVEAAIEGDPRKVFHAVCFDPLTSAVLSLDEIKQMVDEMMLQNKAWLPQFKKLS